jgi:hypothetical protein
MNAEDAIDLLCEIAAGDVGRRELRPNEAPWIEPLWHYTNAPEIYRDRNWRNKPYCAAGMCAVLGRFLTRLTQEGELRFTLGMSAQAAEAWRCKSPAAWGWLAWAQERQVQIVPPVAGARRGDFAIFKIHHIGLVTAATASSLELVEYNTNSAGSREGEGCMGTVRQRSEFQTFIRILP